MAENRGTAEIAVVRRMPAGHDRSGDRIEKVDTGVVVDRRRGGANRGGARFVATVALRGSGSGLPRWPG